MRSLLELFAVYIVGSINHISAKGVALACKRKPLMANKIIIFTCGINCRCFSLQVVQVKTDHLGSVISTLPLSMYDKG